jgi:hypothetical protein
MSLRGQSPEFDLAQAARLKPCPFNPPYASPWEAWNGAAEGAMRRGDYGQA